MTNRGAELHRQGWSAPDYCLCPDSGPSHSSFVTRHLSLVTRHSSLVTRHSCSSVACITTRQDLDRLDVISLRQLAAPFDLITGRLPAHVENLIPGPEDAFRI